jgi:hypothetical protein
MFVLLGKNEVMGIRKERVVRYYEPSKKWFMVGNHCTVGFMV